MSPELIEFQSRSRLNRPPSQAKVIPIEALLEKKDTGNNNVVEETAVKVIPTA
jgi:hypothetical protein